MIENRDEWTASQPGSRAVPGRVRVLFIIEYTRSGGTIFSLALGSAPSALAIGEASFFHLIAVEQKRVGRFHPMDYCSCGVPFASCPLWSAVKAGVMSQPNGYEPTFPIDIEERSRRVPLNVAATFLESIPITVLRQLFRSSRLRRQLTSLETLVRSAARSAGVRTIVDKSGLPEQGMLYLFMPDVEVRFVHLVRNGQDLLSGMLDHMDAQDVEGGPGRLTYKLALSVTFGWVYRNLLASIFGFAVRDRYLLVRYEDLVDHPAETLRRVGTFARLDMEGVIESVLHGRRLEPGHMMQSNRAKFDPVLRTSKSSSTHALPTRKRSIIFSLGAGWLGRLYGYR